MPLVRKKHWQRRKTNVGPFVSHRGVGVVRRGPLSPLDVVTIAKRLGHSNPNITPRTYAHLFRQKDDKAATAINEALAKW